MPVVARLNQYAQLQTGFEFDETTANNIGVGTTGLFTASEFIENVGLGETDSLYASIFPPYDYISGEFGENLYGPGQGVYMRHTTDKSLIIYDEIDEVTGISTDGGAGAGGGGGGGGGTTISRISGGRTTAFSNTTGAPYPPDANWTGIQNANVDDASVLVILPFDITWAGQTPTNTIYVSSNCAITRGVSDNTFNFSINSPAVPAICIGGADNSYQRVSTRAYGTDYFRIRFEGNGATSGVVGAPGIIYEATFFNPLVVGGLQVVEVIVGNHNRTAGVFNVKSSNSYYAQSSLFSNTSYVFEGNSTGTVWTINASQRMSPVLY